MRPSRLLVLAAGALFSLLIAACAEENPEVSAKEGASSLEDVTSVDVEGVPPVASFASIPPEKTRETVCSACHGPDGEGKLELGAPSIAGIPGWALKEQLRKFRAGLRGTHPEDVGGMQMRMIALALTEEQIARAAEDFSELTPFPTPKQGDKASLDRGRYLYANRCMECHRYNGMGEIVFHSSPLIFLNREYLFSSIEKFRKGLRGAHPKDGYGLRMGDISRQLSEKDIEDLVNFIGSLAHGDDARPALEK